MIRLFTYTIISLALMSSVQAQQVQPYSPTVGRDFPTNVYFGDTHLHTKVSLDSYGDGNTRVGPDEAYRFAKGETSLFSRENSNNGPT